MKKYKIYLSVILIYLAFGCTDLEENPTNILSPEGFFQSVEDVEIVTRGAYANLPHHHIWGDALPLYLWLSSDMCSQSTFGALGARQSYDEFPLDPGNVHIENMWNTFYLMISGANSAIEGATFVPNLTDAEIKEAQASAHFIRGYSYYFIAMLWGDAPYIDTFVRDTDAIAQIKSTKEAELLQHAIEDFQFAKDHLSPNTDTKIRSLPTKGTAASLLASIYLYIGDYANAYKEAKWVIDNKNLYNYGLEEDYVDLFIEDKQDQLIEPIFTADYLQNINDGDINRDWIGPLTTVRGSAAGGWGLAVPETKVFETWDDRDYRKDVNMLDSMWFRTNDGGLELRHYSTFPLPPRPHIEKWAGRFNENTQANGNNSGNNIPLMRYAEILLIAAEAGAEVNGVSPELEGYVNQVRARARNWNGKMTDFPADVPTGLSKDEFIDLVIDERRLEFAFEFKRWFDIKRRDMGNWVFKENPDRLEDRPTFQAPRDYHWYIPGPVLAVNPNLAETE
ncbi:RagB/SusD family nutrient uptake outer membrane protein [Flexithrix dorotheae]|uniref:RagB/SusD family nutrient uptake outer membrane protein n=1 Tax=Flexithrix dorotheae TaxID=70993 RepID=UPI00036CCFB6|nr:RagB/SusD family nutrient uptake outer membrane protein [Flexithrix dorotheae]